MNAPAVSDGIVDLDVVVEPRSRAPHALIGALLVASIAFIAGVSVARPAEPTSAATPQPTAAPATTAPRATAVASTTPYKATTSIVPIGNGFVVIDRPTEDAVIFRYVPASADAHPMNLH